MTFRFHVKFAGVYVVDGIHTSFTQRGSFRLVINKKDPEAPVRSMFSKTKTPQSLRFSYNDTHTENCENRYDGRCC